MPLHKNDFFIYKSDYLRVKLNHMLKSTPRIIFVTAYTGHIVEAFDLDVTACGKRFLTSGAESLVFES